MANLAQILVFVFMVVNLSLVEARCCPLTRRYVYGKLTIQEFILIGDKALYQSLARELIVSSPDGAVKVIMIASLVVSAEGDVGTFEFDYVNSDGIRTWFPFGIDINTRRIRELLTELRESCIAEGQPEWNGCEFVVDLVEGSFQMDLSYP
ncbi:hypothetical protein HYO33_23140 [Vibrio parahaemolyticus]|nr:hypothetical protein [Vibrio parahaemolyticus]